MRRFVRVLAGLVVLTLALAAAPALASGPVTDGPGPFPPGDDGVRYHVVLDGVSCGPTALTYDGHIDYVGIPVAGATVGSRLVRDGRVVFESDLVAPAATGSGTLALPSTVLAGPSYPLVRAVHGVVAIGGERTYVGGTSIFCLSAGATPILADYEDYFPPCGVGDRPVFPDVPATSQFCEDVAWALDRDITTGYLDGGFHPTSPVTRQAMAAFLYRAAGWPAVPVPCAAPPFPDVLADHPFCPEITWLAGEGITGGYADGGFHPAAPVSRQATAAFLYRAAGEPRGADPSCPTAPFPDVPTSHPFCGEIDWLADTGITGGYADGGFHPAAAVSRQAMAAFLHRFQLLS